MKSTKTDKLTIALCALVILAALAISPFRPHNDGQESPQNGEMNEATTEPKDSTTTLPRAATKKTPKRPQAKMNGTGNVSDGDATQNETRVKYAGFRSLPSPMSGGCCEPPDNTPRKEDKDAGSSNGSGGDKGNGGSTSTTTPSTTTSLNAKTTSSTSTTNADGGKKLDGDPACTSTSTTTTTTTTCGGNYDTSSTTSTTSTTLCENIAAPEFGSIALLAAIVLAAPAYACMQAAKRSRL